MKAIITDLDRTLLHTDKSVSEYTIEVLRKCHEHGIYVMAASARPLRSIQVYHDLIGFDAVTTMNGAIVLLPQSELESGISRESGEKILAGLLQFQDIFLSIETNTGLYSNREIPEWNPVVYDNFPRLPDHAVLYKILVKLKNRQLYEGVQSILTDDVYHTVAANELIQIMSIDATKWKGIQHMLSHFGISPRDTVYFGDDNDDIEPIKNCGLGVAVSNAIPPVLHAADQVAASNDMDGVAQFIDQYILR